MALASPPRDPWEDDSDADFASAASFELDACSDAGEDSGDHRDARLPSPPASPGALVDADDDFRDCVEGLRLDDGYFAEAAYRGQPDAREGKARGGLDPGALDVLNDADLERAVSGAGEARRGASATSDYAASEDADWSAASPGLRPRRVGGGAGVVREAMSRAAAEAILGEHEDDRRADPTARDLPSSAHLVPADVRGAARLAATRAMVPPLVTTRTSSSSATPRTSTSTSPSFLNLIAWTPIVALLLARTASTCAQNRSRRWREDKPAKLFCALTGTSTRLP